jgi:anti-sigma B factor antagonist
MRTDPTLTMRISQSAGYAVATATGSIDATTSALLDEQLDQALELTQTAVIVDLTEVDFCDSTGLHTFVQARRKADARGITLVLAGLRNRVEYVSTISQLERAFFCQPDLNAAIQWLDNGSNGQTDDGPLPALSELNQADQPPADGEPGRTIDR